MHNFILTNNIVELKIRNVYLKLKQNNLIIQVRYIYVLQMITTIIIHHSRSMTPFIGHHIPAQLFKRNWNFYTKFSFEKNSVELQIMLNCMRDNILVIKAGQQKWWSDKVMRWSVKRFIASISLPALNASSLHCFNFFSIINVLPLYRFPNLPRLP